MGLPNTRIFLHHGLLRELNNLIGMRNLSSTRTPLRDFVITLNTMNFMRTGRYVSVTGRSFDTPTTITSKFGHGNVIPLRRRIRRFRYNFFLLAVVFTDFIHVSHAHTVFFRRPMILRRRLHIPRPTIAPTYNFANLLNRGFLYALTNDFTNDFFSRHRRVFQSDRFTRPPILHYRGPSV